MSKKGVEITGVHVCNPKDDTVEVLVEVVSDGKPQWRRVFYGHVSEFEDAGMLSHTVEGLGIQRGKVRELSR